MVPQAIVATKALLETQAAYTHNLPFVFTLAITFLLSLLIYFLFNSERNPRINYNREVVVGKLVYHTVAHVRADLFLPAFAIALTLATGSYIFSAINDYITLSDEVTQAVNRASEQAPSVDELILREHPNAIIFHGEYSREDDPVFQNVRIDDPAKQVTVGPVSFHGSYAEEILKERKKYPLYIFKE